MRQSLETLKEYWGYSSFREPQADIIDSILSGKDTLALLPTGGGKSLCYQLPALLQEGVCLVISPLIALMQDQVDQLRKRDIKAVAIHSGLNHNQIQVELENAAKGRYKVLYTSPERLLQNSFKNWLKSIPVSFIAVDEAHCISQWGHDFRPAYRKIQDIRNQLSVPLIALTATATPKVQEDIQRLLSKGQMNVFSKSFKRENLYFSTIETENKHGKLIEILHKTKGSAIVYSRNRKRCKEIARFLSQEGIPSDYYHGGLSPKERTEKQHKWVGNEIRCMVCTNAFGMGIDKSDVRLVVHESPPENLEAYYQEAGRAGRDGKKAHAVLLFHRGDSHLSEKLLAAKFPPSERIEQVANSLHNYYKLAVGSGLHVTKEFDLLHFAKTYKYQTSEVYHILNLLTWQEIIHLSDAVFAPAKLKIMCSYNDLYSYRLQHDSANALFDLLLRKNQRLFDVYSPVHLAELSHKLSLRQEQVKRQFMFLHNQGIIDFRPASSKPMITFLQARSPSFVPKLNSIESLRKQYLWKHQQVENYLYGNPPCLQNYIVTYFGEKAKEPCGRCSSCRHRNKRERLNFVEKLKIQIIDYCETEERAQLDILKQIPELDTKYAEEALRLLIDEGILVPSNERPLYWKKRKK